MTKDICGNIYTLVEDERKAILAYTDFLKIIDEKYREDIAEILKDETDHFAKLGKIKEEKECSETLELGSTHIYKKLEIGTMKNMSIEEIIKLYREGYRV